MSTGDNANSKVPVEETERRVAELEAKLEKTPTPAERLQALRESAEPEIEVELAAAAVDGDSKPAS